MSFLMIWLVLKPLAYTDAGYRKNKSCLALTQPKDLLHFYRASQHYIYFSKRFFKTQTSDSDSAHWYNSERLYKINSLSLNLNFRNQNKLQGYKPVSNINALKYEVLNLSFFFIYLPSPLKKGESRYILTKSSENKFNLIT